MNNTIIVSFSGGRTSAFMSKYVKENYSEDKIFIFANTGKEREETLEFVYKCDIEFNLNLVWVEFDLKENKPHFKIVDYNTASRNGEPFEKMIMKYGLPNQSRPHCTRELKLGTITRYLRSIGIKKSNYKTAIGIRADEIRRINWESAKKNNYFYPLATDFRVTSEYIRNFWDNQCFDLKLKDYEGNCDMCWKKSKRKLLTIILEKPDLVKWWSDMEIKYGREEYTFFRNNESALDLIEMSKGRFNRALDKHEIEKQQNTLFDYKLDAESDCFCKF